MALSVAISGRCRLTRRDSTTLTRKAETLRKISGTTVAQVRSCSISSLTM